MSLIKGFTLLISFAVFLAPNTAPKQVRINRLNATHMNISWEKLTLEEARGFLTDYTITYATLESRPRRDVRMEMVHPDSSYKVIGGLGYTESYSVTVSASTSVGGVSSVAILSQGKPLKFKHPTRVLTINDPDS